MTDQHEKDPKATPEEKTPMPPISPQANKATEAAEIRRLHRALMRVSVPRRQVLARSAEFASVPLAWKLLAESLREQPANPRDSEELARLALLIARQPHPRELASQVADARARACSLIGNARRLRQERTVAEDMFRQAAFNLTGPPDSPERAFYCRMLAPLRRDQGHLDEAIGLLWRAAAIYGGNEVDLDEGLCLAELGCLLLDEGQPERALAPLERAWRLLDPRFAPAASPRAGLSLALCFAEQGEVESALSLVERCRPMLERAGGDTPMLHWLDGRVALLTGRPEVARGLLEAARRGFFAGRRLHEASLATLDLALLAAEAGKLERFHPLLHDLGHFFALDLRLAAVLRTLDGFGLAALRGGGDLRAAAATAADRLRRLRRSPRLGLEAGGPRSHAVAPPPAAGLS